MSGENIEKARETPIDREKPKTYSQPFLDGFLKADAEAREKMIDDTTRQLHLARQFIRFEKAQKLSHNEKMKSLLETYKRQTLKLMEK